jgi:hypothetical protein
LKKNKDEVNKDFCCLTINSLLPKQFIEKEMLKKRRQACDSLDSEESV